METAKSLAGRTWRHFMHDSLYRNSIFLMASTAITSLTGFLFWTLGARAFSAESIGLASSLVTATTFLATVGFLGLDFAVIRYLPNMSERRSEIINTALSTAALTTLTAACVYLLLIPTIAPELSFISRSSIWIAIFLLVCVMTSWNTLVSNIFIALRVSYLVLVIGVCFGLVRLPLLWLVGQKTTEASAFIAHACALGCTLLLSMALMAFYQKLRYRATIFLVEVRSMWKYAAHSYASSLTTNIPPLVLPLIVLNSLGAEAVAFYYIPVLIASFLSIIPMATSQSLFAESVTSRSNSIVHLKKACKSVYGFLLPAVVILAASAKLILSAFGETYADQGYELLIILTLGSLIKGGNYLLSTYLRIHDEVKSIAAVTALYTSALLLLGYGAIAWTHSIASVGVVMVACDMMSFIIYALLVRSHLTHQRQKKD